MKYKLKITDITKEFRMEENKEVMETVRHLDVAFEILGDDESVAKYKLAFPMDSSEEDIKASLQKYLVTFALDATSAEKYKEENEQDKEVTKIIENLKGSEYENET